MKTYQQDLTDPRWQKKRLEIMQAADFKCEDCGRRDMQLEVHHCAYITGRRRWEYDGALLMCVCRLCHEHRQRKEDAIRVSIGKITRFLKPNQIDAEVWEVVQEMALRETVRLASAFSTTEDAHA